MGRDPIPLTPEILHLLDRLEPDKGKQARLLTEHLTGQRTLPATEQELQQQLEKRTQRELRKQQAAAEASATILARAEQEALEAALAAHEAAKQQAQAAAERLNQEAAIIAQQCMVDALAAGVTTEEAIQAGQAAKDAYLGAGSPGNMQA